MSKVELNTVAVMFYSGNYNGHEPPYDIAGLKQGDLAQDNSTGVLWEYIGNQWFRKASTSGCKIFLGSGLNIAEAIANETTVIPSFLEVYPGNSDNVPREFNLSANDLVIKHKLGNPPLVYANYFGEDCIWHSVQPLSGTIVTDNTCEWTMWSNFANLFLPHSTLIGIIDIGYQNVAGYEPSSESSGESESSESSDSSESSESSQVPGGVYSVNGQVGDVVLTAEDVGAVEAPEDAGSVGQVLKKSATGTTWDTIEYPVVAVNNKTGDVELSAADVGAIQEPEETGSVGQVLTKTAHGVKWGDVVSPVTSVNGKTGEVSLTAADVGALDAAGQEIIQQSSTSIEQRDNKVYKHLLSANDEIIFNTSVLSADRQVTFELHLTQPSTAVAFTLPSSILWEKDGKFDTSNEPPAMNEANTQYCVVIRWDGENLLGNASYSKTV